MGTRADLHEILKDVLGTDNVYFQPPASLNMAYPCIVYRRDNRDARFANNGLYKNRKRYLVTVIDQNPDSDIPDKVGVLPLCSFDRFYAANNLNHDAFRLFF